MDVGARVAEVLRAVGVEALFGVPGGQTLPLYRATRATGMNHVVMRDERNAACAADAYARVSGRIGVCDATVGPGVTNLISGLAEAHASSIPVLAVVADIRTDQQHLRRRSVVSQATDQSSLLTPVTKWVGRVERAATVDDVLDHALRVATSGRPGPVALEIPEDVWLEEATPSRSFAFADACAPRARPAPEPEAIVEAATLLSQAQRPLILAGGGTITSGAATELAGLSSEFRIPVVTTINGKGAIDERDQLGLGLGVVGLFGGARAVRALDDADVVVVLGSKLDQFSTHGWRLPRPEARIVHVDVDGEELGRVRPADVAMVADAREALRALRAHLSDTPAKRRWWTDPPEETTTVTDIAVARPPRLHPARVVEALDEVLGPDDCVVCDASYASGWAAKHLRVGTPRRFVAPRGLAGVGWSGGAAIGASVAAGPGGRVAVLAGDGGFAYGMSELETAARLGADITSVVLNNAALGWIVHGEENMEIAPTSTYGDVDFATVARGLGAESSRVTTLDELTAQLAKAVEDPRPWVIDAVTSAEPSPIVSLRRVRGTPASTV